jgi:catechol 2,3-dioxygenase-like lactoylglutathione lyase family enzyme
MLANSRVIYMFVYVRDLDVSREFYRDALGLRVIEEDSACVKFDCGHVILALNRAADFNIVLPDSRDRSTEIVFLVDSVAETRAVLESRGVQFQPTSSEEPGQIANFYDPDGHWYTLYEPNEQALSWPSGKRVQALMKAQQSRNGNGGPQKKLNSSGASGNGCTGLDGSEILYEFLFVRNVAETQAFYHDYLGLQDIEGGPCSQSSTEGDDGVVKYDTGVLLTTHLRPTLEPDEHLKSITTVFHVNNIEHVANTLSRKGKGFTYELVRSEIGVTASFEDPTGHRFYLYEPSEAALRTPSGQKIQEILAAEF